MSKKGCDWDEATVARFVVALQRETIEVVYPEPSIGGGEASYYITPPAVFAGGIRLAAGAAEIRALVNHNVALREEIERLKDGKRAKARSVGGKLTIAPDGSVTVEGGTVVVRGPVHVEGVQ